jgi:uncharacterized protein YcfJ
MITTPTPHRIHPLLAVAAVSVTVVSLLGIAAITGVLPSSHGLTSPSKQDAALVSPDASRTNSQNQATLLEPQPTKRLAQGPAKKPAPTVDQGGQQVAAAPAPVAQPAPEKNSAIGIGVGALVGGALGSRVGSGDGKTLATIAGAIGGGYIGNEVAKKNQK